MSNGSSTVRLAAELRGLAAAAPPGAALPSTRELTRRHRVSPVTVARALALLTSEGVVVTEPGRGTFVAAAPQRLAPPAGGGDTGWQTVALQDRTIDSGEASRLLELPPPGALVLNSGYLDEALQPGRALADALARAARLPGGWGRAPVSGTPELRSVFGTLVGVDPADVLVTPGGQAGLSAALRALVPPGGPVVVESPTYQGVLAVARAAGLRPVPVPTDGDGLRPDLLDQALAMTGARLAYCQPTYANPTASVLPAQRRREVLAVVAEHRAFLLEDDWARGLTLGADPPPPALVRDDPDGHVVHVTSLTKAAAPSLRVGALVARGPAAARLRALRTVDDFFVPLPLQAAAVDLVTSPGWPRHLARLRRGLTARRDALLAALAAALPGLPPTRVPAGGLHLWLRLPDGVDDVELAGRAALRGLLVSPGAPYFAGEPPAGYLRLTYGCADEAALAAGGRLLGELLSGRW